MITPPTDRASAWLHEVQACFTPDGPLARSQTGYRCREGQAQMALAVAQAIEDRARLVVEAGTGVGKTYAYLVPALLSGRRVMVSTATKALQDQLFDRDLPAVARALGLPLRAALLKGRSSYLCTHRLQQAWQRLPRGDRHLTRWLSEIERWSLSTTSGDLSELPGLDDRSELLPLVTSTRDNCLGSACPQFRGCHVHAARREALAADVVVVNHHLFFADRAVRESGMAELLPSVDVVVFDEAHQLNETGVQFLGEAVATSPLLDWTREMLAMGLQLARGLQDWQGLASALESAVQSLKLAAHGQGAGRPSARKWRWVEAVPQGVDAAGWAEGIERLQGGLQAAQVALAAVAEVSPDLARLEAVAGLMQQRLQAILDPAGEPCARWVESQGGGSGSLRLVRTPLDASAAFSVRGPVGSWPNVAGAAPAGSEVGEAAGPCWIFTSATLGAEPTLRWFTAPLGLSDARTLQVPSPFDYGSQAGLHVPADLPRPADPGHTEALASCIWPWIRRLQGRTLVLTTTLRALKAMGAALEDRCRADALALDVLMQGRGSKRELLQRFRAAGEGGGPGAVLVASASFWEGVDLPGACLQLLVIDKLPFPPPDDPWGEARCHAIEATGGRAFADHALPEAAVALKQGAGRLIRREDDRGILVIGDTRLLTMGYGAQLLAALPPMRRLGDAAQMDAAIEDLVTRSSTMGLPWT